MCRGAVKLAPSATDRSSLSDDTGNLVGDRRLLVVGIAMEGSLADVHVGSVLRDVVVAFESCRGVADALDRGLVRAGARARSMEVHGGDLRVLLKWIVCGRDRLSNRTAPLGPFGEAQKKRARP
jgi:hypothetical protein